MKLGTMSWAVAVAVAALAGCEGPRGGSGPAGGAGPAGANGANGLPGQTGPTGASGTDGSTGPVGASGSGGVTGPTGSASCEVLTPSPPLSPVFTVSAPANGQFFVAGEQPVLSAVFPDRCGTTMKVADLDLANLYLAGPRKGSLTKTASLLVNCVTDRNAADRQHHFINLKAPSYADTTKPNLTEAVDGTLTFKLAAITNETPGTYTAGLWATRLGGQEQAFKTVDLQIGTATAEVYASGEGAASTCDNCHRNSVNGKSYMAHITPGFSPLGNWALDETPIANCKLCHNQDGYSPNTLMRKAHGVHRGKHQLAPGAAHPEYGVGADTSLADFTDVSFPSLPNHERDCAACHVDTRWQTASRAACGTCHDNVYFDTGAISPPTVFGKPTLDAGVVACTLDTDCGGFGLLASCASDGGVNQGLCVATSHLAYPDDTQCASCHPATAAGLATVSVVHDIPTRTKVRDLKLEAVVLTGGTGSGGTFAAGNVPVVKFRLSDKAGAAVVDLATNANLASTAIVAGPTDDRQRVYAVTVKGSGATGTLSYDSGTNLYTYTFASGFPASSLAPLNAAVPTTRANPPGTYTLYLYVTETFRPPNQPSFRDAASTTVDFRFGTSGAIRPRDVVTQAACDRCHVDLQEHGGSRAVANACSTCHTQGAEDRGVGAKGIACVSSAQCPGSDAGWEACTSGVCTVTTDPTPGQTIRFAVLIHSLHSARLREGYSARNGLVPGTLNILGFSNTLEDWSEILFPQDLRNCTRCHADTGAVCSSTVPCGFGQSCTGGACVNTAWKRPSAEVCLACHDSADAFGHAQIMTAQTAEGPIETCDVCHGEGADFTVEKVHNISNPFVPPYAREPEP